MGSEPRVDEELVASELGTIEYWSGVYQRDIENFKNHGDVGEIWFGEDSALRVVRWMSHNVPHDAHVVDLGCGNSMLLLELFQEGYSNLTGFDYCSEAIKLSESILEKHTATVSLKVLDLTEDYNGSPQFNVAVDKGTYDAISLNPDNPSEKKKKYISNVSQMLQPKGLLIITSCNWTDKELINQFESHFTFVCSLPTPKFKFGGQEGSLVSALVFEKNSQ